MTEQLDGEASDTTRDGQTAAGEAPQQPFPEAASPSASSPESSDLPSSPQPASPDESPSAPSSAGEPAISVSDMFRRALVTGLGAAVMTEEGVRSLIRELKIPRETVNAAIGQAERGREAIRRAVSDEARRFLDSPALKKEIARALSRLTIEMTVRIRFNPNGTGPDISFSQPRIRREPSPDAPQEAESAESGEEPAGEAWNFADSVEESSR